MGDPTFHSLGRKRGGSGQRGEALGKRQVGTESVLAGLENGGSRGLGSPSRGWTRNFRTGGFQEPTDLMSGSLEAPICPTQLSWLPAVPEVDRATSYFPVIFISCWSVVAQQRCASFKGTDSAYSFRMLSPCRLLHDTDVCSLPCWFSILYTALCPCQS